jgi:hypothetical protein
MLRLFFVIHLPSRFSVIFWASVGLHENLFQEVFSGVENSFGVPATSEVIAARLSTNERRSLDVNIFHQYREENRRKPVVPKRYFW